MIGPRLQTVSVLFRRIEQRLGESLGVNPTDLAAMEQLISSGPLTASELAARLDVSTAASTDVVDRLERAGHVSRARHPADRRKLVATASEASAARTYQALEPMLSGLDRVVGALDAGDRAVIERFLENVVEVLK